ncbi:MAG: hypothetical protein HY828_09600 [Actinobacteria bacterium]|nr:hypothetical protein [Actinomycetota bacterium]
MSQLKNRLQALSLLDRAFASLTDAELESLVASLPDDHREAVDDICGAKEGGFTDPAARTLAMRATASRGRKTGELEQLSTIVTDPCLAKCIEMLGDHSDNPTEPQLLEITPTLIEDFGLGCTRLMLATSVAGEAAASVMLTRVLKHDETLGLPPAPVAETTLLPAPQADEDLKAKRKAAKEKKQADARARREQQLRAAKRV